MENHIITLALQAHNGEQDEPHNSKRKQTETREQSDCSLVLFFFLDSRLRLSFAECRTLDFGFRLAGHQRLNGFGHLNSARNDGINRFHDRKLDVVFL